MEPLRYRVIGERLTRCMVLDVCGLNGCVQTNTLDVETGAYHQRPMTLFFLAAALGST